MGQPGDSNGDDDSPDPQLGGYVDPPLEECPVTFLGHFDKYVVFVTSEGQIREEKPTDIAKQLKVDIFNTWKGAAFLNYWRDGEDKFMREACATWFVRQCRNLPVWDRSRPHRGLGVWPGRGGEVILHRGEEIWTYPADPGEDVIVQSVAEALRKIRTGPVYDLRPAAPAPDDPATIEDGKWVTDKLRMWNFDMLGDDGLSGVDLIGGWIVCGLLGAVPNFRPHVLIYAMAASGKTTLIEFIHALQSSLAGDVIDGFTRAGFANDLAGHARPVHIDEVEGSDAGDRLGVIEEMIDLIRRMATGKGATKKMGTIGGGSVTQTAIGSVVMGAINPVRLTSADASRIAEVRLLPLEAPRPAGGVNSATDDDVKLAIAAAKVLSPALLGRALRHSRRYLADVSALKQAFRAYGQTVRGADLAAALAAGSCLLLRDEALTKDQAQVEAARWFGLLESREAAEVVQNPGQDCLAHLMNWPSGVHKHDRIVSIGELVSQWCVDTANGHEVDHAMLPPLREFGLDLEMRPDERGQLRPWLLVANIAPGLSRIYRGTKWGDWRRTLRYLDGLGGRFATLPGPPHRFAVGLIQRSTNVPLDPWFLDSSGHDMLGKAREPDE